MIELCFQTAGLWGMKVDGLMGLPQHVSEVSWSGMLESAGRPLYALVTPHPEQGSFDAEVVDGDGKQYLRLAGYRTVALPAALDAELLKELRGVAATEAVAVS
jgi:hypothetical protein